MPKYRSILAVALITAVGLYFRIYGNAWDQNHHLHPDERFLTMVAMSLRIPASVREYFATNSSPLNPHNLGYSFYVYGTFPLFITKTIAILSGMNDYVRFTNLGRVLSALLDIGSAFWAFALARELARRTGGSVPQSQADGQKVAPYIVLTVYSLAMLPIQLSHFFTVDPFLTFFMTGTIYLAVRSLRDTLRPSHVLALGVLAGLAISSKITAALSLPLLSLPIAPVVFRKSGRLYAVWSVIVLVITLALTVRIFQPYLFQSDSFIPTGVNRAVIDNWRQLRSFDDPNTTFPPSIQWIRTVPVVYPLKQLIVFGLGWPAALVIIPGFALSVLLLRRDRAVLLLWFWTLAYFVFQGSQFAKTLRYIYPILPVIIAFSGIGIAWCLAKFYRRQPVLTGLAVGISVFIIALYPAMYMHIYSRPTTRVTASEWIDTHIPGGSSITYDHWDDPLPLLLNPGLAGKYRALEIPIFGEDTEPKWREIAAVLSQTDYVISSSNRAYGSLMTVPDRYPVTVRYFTMLFDGSLGFEPEVEIVSRPRLPIPIPGLCIDLPFFSYGYVARMIQSCPPTGITFIDDYADEMWTVYDHPKVIIFRKFRQLDDYYRAITSDYFR